MDIDRGVSSSSNIYGDEKMSTIFDPSIPNTTLQSDLISLSQPNFESIYSFSTPSQYNTSNQTLQQGYANTLLDRIIASQTQINPSSLTNYSTSTQYYAPTTSSNIGSATTTTTSNNTMIYIVIAVVVMILIFSMSKK